MHIIVNKNSYEVKDGNFVIPVTPELKAELEKIEKMQRLSSMEPGQVFRSHIGIEYILLEHLFNARTRAIRKNLLPKDKSFDWQKNNFTESEIEEYLNDEYFKEELIPGFGAENIMEREVDLLSMDGSDSYGTRRTKVAPMTFDEYRKYHKKYLTKHMPRPYGLVTPQKINAHSIRNIMCVTSDGAVDCCQCKCGIGVRPVLDLPSELYVFPVD